ncbi:serine/threonine protein kinase [Gemmata sp. JC673]|uniref:Serine/threonine protein kinase n=1 Tax=Gemmata algarum TaxID=2975278 RepID=A0ABU5EZL5_9BACT|nr:serine/threonine-protein kinase [Gemmata algarum]MDY3560611.1 serine/threonine protein kinase [Gemmata algarum]
MNRLDRLLLEWEDRRARGERVGAADLCATPELRPELAERIRLLEKFDELMAPVTTAPTPEPPIPERIGKYPVLKRLGGGGMGTVYKAVNLDLKKNVAIKVLKAGSRSDRSSVERFMQECQVLARFAHKSVVMAYDAGQDACGPYLVMSYLPNGSLREHQQRLTAEGPRAVASLMEKVARAVQDAHSINVIHGDLKPANVLLDEHGVPLIADFGLAAVLAAGADEGAGRLTPRRGAGTPPYMAPEQFDAAFGPIAKPADVWALGVTLFELLTGERPFRPAAGETFRQLVLSAPVPPLPGVPKAIAAVVRKCLERQQEKRFQSAGQLADALHRAGGASRRDLLRRAVAVGGTALGCAAPVAFLASDPYRRFRWRTDGHLTALKHGRSVDLIAPGGTVPPYHLRAGAGTTQVGMSEEGLVVRSTTLALVELLPTLPAAGCEVVLEVRHDFSDMGPVQHSCLGLFFAAARVEHEKLIHHFLEYTTFDDNEPMPVVALGSVRYSELAPGADGVPPPFLLHSADEREYPSVQGAPRPLPFRTLRFHLTPDVVRLVWEGPPRRELTMPIAEHRANASQSVDRTHPGLGSMLRENLAPRLGVFVVGGRITVRKLRVVPFPQQS